MADNAPPAVADNERFPCPSWCLGETYDGVHDVHEGPRVTWSSPRYPQRHGPALCASITLFTEDQGDEPCSPAITFGAGGSWDELDMTQLGALIEGLEEYHLALRGLRRRYAAVLSGADAADDSSEPVVPERPIQVTTPCPAWCDDHGRGHKNTYLVDQLHCGIERTVQLDLCRPDPGEEGGFYREEIWVLLEQGAYETRPKVTIDSESGKIALPRLSLDEARQVRQSLGEVIARAEEHMLLDALPPLDVVLADMRAKVIEDEALSPTSPGYAFGDGDQGGRTWVCVPAGLAPELREERARDLLANVFQKVGKTLWEGEAAPRVIGDWSALASAVVRVAA